MNADGLQFQSGWQILSFISLYADSHQPFLTMLVSSVAVITVIFLKTQTCERITSSNSYFDHFQQIIVALSTSCLCFLSPQSVWFLPSAEGQMGPYGTLIMNSTLMFDPSFMFVWSWWQHALNLSVSFMKAI